MFRLAFILVMWTLAATSAGNRAAELVLVFHLLTILGFLLALKLQQAGASPITVGRMARSTFVVRRTIVEKIKGLFAIGGRGLLHVHGPSPG